MFPVVLLTVYFLTIYPGLITTKLNLNSIDETEVSLSLCIMYGSELFMGHDIKAIIYILPLGEINSSEASMVGLQQSLLPFLQAKLQWNVVVKNLEFPDTSKFKYLGLFYKHFIQIKRPDDLDIFLKLLRSRNTWNPHGKFLVMSPVAFDNPHTVAANLYRVLWNYNILYAAVVLVDNQNVTNFNVYSWNPYSHSNCGNNFNNILPVDTCYFGVTKTNASWFGQKAPKRGHNCTMKVNYMVYPPFVINEKQISQVSHYDEALGLEINLLNLVANTINLSILYEKSSFQTWGSVDADYNATKDLKLLKEGKIDAVLGGYMKTSFRTRLFDASAAYGRDAMIWCVPHNPVLIGSKNFRNILRLEVWILIILFYFVATFCIWYTSSRNRGEYVPYRTVTVCFFNTFSVVVGQSVYVLPRTTKVRFIMFIFFILGLNLNVMYNTYLTSILASPSYREMYQDMESIYKHELDTYLMPNLQVYFKEREPVVEHVHLRVILKRWRNYTNIPKSITRMISERDSAVCVPLLPIRYLLNNELRNKRDCIYCTRKNIYGMQINLLMKKGFPFYKLVDDTIKKISTAGFLQKWHKDILREKSRNTSTEKEYIEFLDLLPVFYTLLVGQIACIMIFVIENIVHYLKQ